MAYYANETKRNDKIIKKEWFHKNKSKWFPCENENFKTGKQTTVPLHSKDLKKGLEDAILKQAGLK